MTINRALGRKHIQGFFREGSYATGTRVYEAFRSSGGSEICAHMSYSLSSLNLGDYIGQCHGGYQGEYYGLRL